ncbi:MAG: hypothetical protein CO030_02605 [Candidatus Magasanikbacteria bacterium CG_4_9_14_0_2_um_filter_42_11]|uniref:DUF4430 domain-containing protein n=1 Tax=Candidatus Magasanikbacteria bacterium CG_4_9_14_0_2_um_filter_42_11 TaxID=1974643 RepID=A0A2M8F9V3_9BACT|nr:MAG: hypothetical protein COU34_05470 [Candidatus Magasanikbacteria bacterium CG10_big_fil_rev_8_21_14_0_10_43_9]PIY92757.1 MAG: hypothetical protein COY70_01595 [Candidatus Magasanikbacteria bacterium CG_4_10_14_0_8_um_filter_42_12]PJC52488.1 MAG: hypothetical protein CO030_02605 [Candidatus Magasanikbacteria bacterium CG_4_9_14_0_2_um_filter_42_11]
MRIYKLTALLLALPILGLGCSSSQKVTTNVYTVNIQTSEEQTTTRIVSLPEEEITMNDLLDAVGIQTKEITQGEHVIITSFDGVIATKSKAWHLYLNNYPATLTNLAHMPVRASDIIEWKYESN